MMECCQHKGQQAVGTCVDCGKGLCAYCLEHWHPALCDECARKRSSSAAQPERGQVKLSLFLGVVGLLGGIVAVWLTFGMKMIWIALPSAYLLAGFPFGWAALRDGLICKVCRLPVAGAALFWLLRLLLAFLLGAIMLPMALYRAKLDW